MKILKNKLKNKLNIRTEKDFPIKGIEFIDINALLIDKEIYNEIIEKFCKEIQNKNIDYIISPEARGFLFGCPVANKLNIGFIPVRKPNKLPRETIAVSYDLEYGSNTLCIHKDSVKPGQKVVIIDDLLATGGTVEATVKLIEQLGGIVVGCAFLIELEELKGRDKLPNIPVKTLLKY